MSLVNICLCDDCGFVVRAEHQAYNRCGRCGSKAQERVFPDIEGSALAQKLLNELGKHMPSNELSALLDELADAYEENGE